ncbi:OmpA family protein [Terriglobus aquaticus]|uniref:OmpA family protein n=1 Tax=Terriglobus aquaticus TaxID=940139 RepID=A0ABW9KKP1_9BACT|nr:OmpA family protein [Terriglobus aquaticus]
MSRLGIFVSGVALAATLSAPALHAQEPNPTAGLSNAGQTARPAGELNGVPLYRVNVVSRDLDAVNYFHRSGSTKINFVGTPLASSVRGNAKVDSEKGRITINLHLDGLTPANGFGQEYLTYVLWAITPDGTPSNLGEVLPTGGGGKVDMTVTTNLQSFGMIVTAEPYFAVRVPSDLVVAQNEIINDRTEGVLEKVNAHFSLLPRGAYAQTAGPKTVMDPITRNEHSPLELYEAHNAYNIARMAGAEQFAPDILSQVRTNLQNADQMDASKHRDEKMEITYAREAVQRSEDARILSLRKQQQLAQQAQIDARHAAEQQAQQSQLEAAQAAAAAAQAQAAADREAAQRARAEADAANAQAAADQARAQADAAKQSVVAIRERLRAQLNAVLATQETARGLIVTLGDVLFDTGKYTLKQNAQISLAKVSAILQQYPDLRLQIEGYTDSVGSDELNQKLSDSRARATQDFLVQQGVSAANITAVGYGKTNPVADNSTAAGRAQNRRVEMVVSGPSIGVQTQDPTATPAGNAAPTGTAAPAGPAQ